MGYLYFRQLKIVGREQLPAKGPAILAINHQNALLDALLISGLFWRNTYFITRGDIFEGHLIGQILRGFKMLPVYRVRDGYYGLNRNDETFYTAKKLLLQGKILGIFPEGSHSLLYKIRPLKKGVVRIAFMTAEATDFNSGLKIIPVGIQYESHSGPKGRTLISFGSPIAVDAYKEIYHTDPNRADERLLNELSIRMKSLVLDIEGDYKIVYSEFLKKRCFKNSITDQLQADRLLISAIENKTTIIQSDDSIPGQKLAAQKIWTTTWAIIGFMPKQLVEFLVRRFTIDPHYYGTMRFIYSIFLYPIFFLLLFFVIVYLAF